MTNTGDLQKLTGAVLNSKYQLGAALGEGACGAVYEVLKVKSGKSTLTPFAAKVAVLPTSAASSNKKRKKTAEERNADLLSHEHVLYFNALSSLRGNMVPDIPLPGSSGPSSMGEFQYNNGRYRYVVMEKMQYPLSYLIPPMFQGKVLISDVFTRLIRLMQSMHGLHYVFVDVKPENFMLASSTKECVNLSDIASEIRMIDVALIESSKDIMRNGKHRIDAYPDGQMVGTPIYASRNVMTGHTPSRRDDLEAIGYVVLELMLLVGQYGDGNKSDNISLLPWSIGKSDEDVLKRKVDAIEEKDKGAFWSFVTKHLGEVSTRIMKNYLHIVSNLEFKQQPDYEALVALVQGMTIYKDNKIRPKTIKKSIVVTQSDPATTELLSSTKTLDAKISKEITESPRSRRAASRNARKGTQLVKDQNHSVALEEYIESSNDVIMKSPSPEEEQSIEDMDWESHKSTAMKSKVNPSLIIECTSGPHKGEHRILQTSMVLGRNPKSSKVSSPNSAFELKNDDKVSDSHTKLLLSTSGRKKSVLMVKVTDLNSSHGTFVNGKELVKGGYRQGFINDCIQIGRSEFRIKKP